MFVQLFVPLHLVAAEIFYRVSEHFDQVVVLEKKVRRSPKSLNKKQSIIYQLKGAFLNFILIKSKAPISTYADNRKAFDTFWRDAIWQSRH